MRSKTYKINCPSCDKKHETDMFQLHLFKCGCGREFYIEVDTSKRKTKVEITPALVSKLNKYNKKEEENNND